MGATGDRRGDEVQDKDVAMTRCKRTAGGSRWRRRARGRGVPPGNARQAVTPIEPVVHPSEAAVRMSSSLGILLASHVVRDGEVVLLILKPSLWFIAIQSIIFAAVAALVAAGADLSDPHAHLHNHLYVEGLIFVISGRVMWAVLQWMSRLYMLTDMRILRISGIFNIDVFDCPLRKVSTTRMVSSARERVLGLGSVEIVPRDGAAGVWQTINKPLQVREQIVAAINRAKQGTE